MKYKNVKSMGDTISKQVDKDDLTLGHTLAKYTHTHNHVDTYQKEATYIQDGSVINI